ncbi:MAG: DUF1929 domain-containing protein [Meiothermus sp.]|uniref:galactose oxidase-like domain-containing protein n=1 Tax=Meiothermus sp. TaxID=1955249 RepID=UPI0025CF8795|nr:galactose oxidase-like domain-containing protein [Meiothermus sp.]MCS7194721.1 DUF1929 domain-containing protein [Meiothermus sp.]
MKAPLLPLGEAPAKQFHRFLFGLALALLLAGCPQNPQPSAPSSNLEPPRSVMAWAVSPTQVELSWKPPQNVANPSYEIERRIGNEAFQPLASGLNSPSHTDRQIVSGGKTFVYRVRTKTAQGQSDWVESNPVPVPMGCSNHSGNGPAHEVGCFGPVVDNWPLVATYIALLPNGKVVAWYASDDIGRYREKTDVHELDPHNNPPGQEDGTMAVVWDPTSGAFEDVSFGNGSQQNGRSVSGQPKGTDLFCAGYTVLNDGRLFTAGGNLGLEWGSPRTNIFDPRTNTWTPGPGPTTPDMWWGRWYPTVTKLPNGELLITGGTSKPNPSFVEGSTDPRCRTPSGRCPEGLAQGKPHSTIANAPGLDKGVRTQNARGTAHNNAFEVYDPDTSTLRMLEATAAEVNSFEHYYPWWHIAPNGLAFLSGAGKQKGLLDWRQGQWTGIWESTSHGIPYDAHRVYGSSVMYEPGKVLVIGGGYAADDWSSGELAIFSLNNWENGHTTLHITLAQNANTPPTMTPGPKMRYSRTHLDATLLANGDIFVNGGQQDGGENTQSIPGYAGRRPTGARPVLSGTLAREWWPKTVNPATVFNIDLAVYQSEIWKRPASGGTGHFVLGPRAQRPRIYHSASLLLPDATVLTVGGGGCGECAGNFETGGRDEGYYGRWYGRPEKINQKNHEIYYPAYLFKEDGSLAPRPIIAGLEGLAPETDYPTLAYNQRFTVRWAHPDPARSIQKVTFVALGAPTHGFDQNQRYLELDFQQNGYTLTVRAPYDGQYGSPSPGGARNIAPPGFYMLFLIDDKGVPSVARILRIR